MKKILALLLCLTIAAVPCLPVWGDAVYSDMEDSTYREDVELLYGLGILEGYLADEYRPDDTITRSEFSMLAAMAAGYSAQGGTFAANYADVDEGYWAYSYIGYLEQHGFVSPAEAFRPEDGLLYFEAVKILDSIAGQQVLAAQYGGYPMGYVRAAADLGILDGVTAQTDGTITRGQAARLVKNTLFAPYMQLVSIGAAEDYSLSKYHSVMTQYLDIAYATGLVTADAYTSLTDAQGGVPAGSVMIDSQRFLLGSADAPLLGSRVRYFYREDENGGEPQLVYCDREQRLNTIYRADVRDLTHSGYTYTNTETEESYAASPSAKLIYNGKAWVGTNPIFFPQQGFVTLVDNNQDGTIDVVLAEEYHNYLVSGVDDIENVIFCQDGTQFAIDVHKDDVTLYYGDVEMELSDLKRDDVISVYAGGPADSRLYRIYVSQTVLSGGITSWDDEGLTAGGEQHLYAKEFAGREMVTANGVYQLDYLGQVVAAKESAGTGYAYMAGLKKATGIDDTVSVRLFTQEGTLSAYDLSERVTYNGEPADALDVFDKLGGASAACRMVRYATNAEGKVNRLDTEDGTELTVATVNGKEMRKYPTQYKPTSKIFGDWQLAGGTALFGIDAQTVVFMVPDDPGDERGYRSMAASELEDDTQYVVTAYNMDELNNAKAVLINESEVEAEVPKGNYSTMVERIFETVNDEGDIVRCMTGYTYLGAVRYYEGESNALAGVSAGDIIRVAVNNHNEITKLLKQFDVSGDDTSAELSYTNRTMGAFNDTYRCFVGKVLDANDTRMLLEVANGGEAGQVTELVDYKSVKGVQTFLFDEKTGRLTDITGGTIPSDGGQGHVWAFVRTVNANLRSLFLYRLEDPVA